MSIRVVLTDDHLVVRQGLRVLLEQNGVVVVAEGSDGRQAIELCQRHRPDVAILDLAMPVLNGLDAAEEIAKAVPSTKVILLTMHTDDRYVLKALRVGVRGYVLKSRAASGLLEAIREVSAGHIYLSPSISHTVVDAFLNKQEVATDPLSSRERQVLQLVAEGKTTKEVANILGLSVKTVESHRTRIMDKLGIHEVAGLVRYAIRTRLIEA